MNRLLLVIFTFLFVGFGFSQAKLQLYGKITDHHSKKAISAATITVYDGGTVVKTVNTSGNGAFNMQLPFNKKYKVVVSKPGKVSKFFDVDVNGIEEEDLPPGNLKLQTDLTIFDESPDVDFSFLSTTPVASFFYDPMMGGMDYSKSKLKKTKSRIEKLLEEAEQKGDEEDKNRKEFDKLMAEGDGFFQKKNYAGALQKYEAALQLISGDPLAKAKIKDTKDKLAELEKEADYNKFISEADGAFGNKNYQVALEKYNQALNIKPNESHPTQRIIEIEELLAKQKKEEEEQEKKEQEYKNLITAAENFEGKKDLENAIKKYQEALVIKPDESYPKGKITELQALIDKQNADAKKKEDFDKLIAEADGLFTSKDYETAKSKYQEALTIIPGEAHPTTRITEIDKLLADQAKEKELEEKYNKYIEEGTTLISSKSWAEAKSKFEQALGLKPNEQLPKDKIAFINEEMQKEVDKANLEAEYNKLIEEGNTLFGEKKYEEAKAKFQEAITKKDQEYPRNKIKEIEDLLADLASEKADQEKYDKLMAEAKTFFDAKEYEDAKQKYNNALLVKPDEQEPKDQLAKIKQLQADEEEARKAAEKEAQYQKYMDDGNAKFTNKDYKSSIDDYKAALVVKPNDADALAKIDEAKAKIKEAEELAKKEEEEKAYQTLIDRGIELIGSEKWSDAKVKFEDALKMRPNETLPKEKIEFINGKIAEMDAEEAKNNQYNSLIGAADDYYNTSKWNEAKAKYEEALLIKPDESHPQERLAKIKEKLEELEKNSAKLKEYNEKLALADDAFNSGKYKESIPLYEAASKVDPDQVYPNSQILKAKEKIKENEAKEENAVYQALIDEADELFNNTNYEKAIEKYGLALASKPGEVYPQSQIDKINEIKRKQKEAAENKEKTEKEYQEYLTKGENALSSDDLNDALKNYQEASYLKPDESLPKTKIAEIKALIKKKEGEEEIDSKYQAYIDQADQMFNSNDFKGAIVAYESALSIKPNESYPQERIKKAQENLAALLNNPANNEKYEQYMKEGRKYIQKSNMLDAAEDYFKRALAEKPGDQAAQDALNEIKQIREDAAEAERLKQENEEKYRKLIQEADGFFEKKDWKNATDKYGKAINIFDREYPREQLELIKKKQVGPKIIVSDKMYNKIIAVADKAFAGEDYEKATRLYKKASGIREDDQYPKDQLKAIEDLLFKKDKTNVDLSDLGTKVSVSLDEMDKIFGESITNIEWIESSEIEKVKYNFAQTNDSLGNVQDRGIVELTGDIDLFKKERELLTVKMDDGRKENVNKVEDFNTDMAKNRAELGKEEWMDIEKVSADVELMVMNQNERFAEADKKRQDMEEKVVAYNIDMSKNSADRNAETEVEIEKLKMNIENHTIEMNSSFSSMDNSRIETAENTELYVDNLERHKTKLESNKEDEIHNLTDDLAEFHKNVEEADIEADEDRKKTVKDLESYNDGLEIHETKVAAEFVDKARDTKEDADLLVYKRDQNISKYDEEREENIVDIEKMTTGIEKNKAEIEKENIKDQDEAKKLADQLMTLRSEDFNEKIANDLADKFPQGMTEEIFKQENDRGEVTGYVVRRIVVEGDRGDIYIMRKNRFGTTYTKNGAPTTKFVWDDESLR